MKILINYDFYNAICDVIEPIGPTKIIRNEKERYLTRAPLWFSLDYSVLKDFTNAALVLGMQYMMAVSSDILIQEMVGIDTYATIAMKRLKELVRILNDNYINTDYELLMKSQMYAKRYYINNDKFGITQEKYIMVPTNNNDSVRDTSILQEHVLGSNEYILSVGRVNKSKRLVRSLA